MKCDNKLLLYVDNTKFNTGRFSTTSGLGVMNTYTGTNLYLRNVYSAPVIHRGLGHIEHSNILPL